MKNFRERQRFAYALLPGIVRDPVLHLLLIAMELDDIIRVFPVDRRDFFPVRRVDHCLVLCRADGERLIVAPGIVDLHDSHIRAQKLKFTEYYPCDFSCGCRL